MITSCQKPKADFQFHLITLLDLNASLQKHAQDMSDSKI